MPKIVYNISNMDFQMLEKSNLKWKGRGKMLNAILWLAIIAAIVAVIACETLRAILKWIIIIWFAGIFCWGVWQLLKIIFSIPLI